MVEYLWAWVAEWYTRESQKLVVVMTLRVRVSPQAPSRTVLEGALKVPLYNQIRTHFITIQIVVTENLKIV